MSAIRGETPPEPDTPSEARARWDALIAEFDRATKDFESQVNAAESDADREKLFAERPGIQFAPRFVAFVKENATDPLSIEVAVMAARANIFEAGLSEALAKIAEHQAGNESVVRLFEELGQIFTPGFERFCSELVENSPNRQVRGRACLAAGKYLAALKENLRSLPAPDSPKDAELERLLGRDVLAQVRQMDSRELMIRAEQYLQRALDEFGDLQVGGTSVAEIADRELKSLRPDPALDKGYYSGPEVGDLAPRLSPDRWLQRPVGVGSDWASWRGQVVVVEFWSIYCGPCVAVIPHLNELMERFKEKPVRFISVCRDSLEELLPFLQKHPVDGWIAVDSDGLTHRLWDVEAWPHMVIVDREGRVAKLTDPRNLTEQDILMCLAGEPLPQANEPGGDREVGVVPEQYKIGRRPVFQALIRPASKANQVNTWGTSGLTLQPGTLEKAIRYIYHISKGELQKRTELPKDLYDFYINVPADHSRFVEPVFEAAVASAFGLSVKRAAAEADVLVLRQPASHQHRVPPASPDREHENVIGWNRVSLHSRPVTSLAEALQQALGRPVMDETGLTGRFDFELSWDQRNYEEPNVESAVEAVKNKLGLDLVADRRTLEMVVVEAIAKEHLRDPLR